MQSAGKTLLSIADIAERYGLTAPTVRTYNGQATQRRRAGTPTGHDFPPAVARVGNSPLFDADEVEGWFRNRPGRGAGGGRPRKSRVTIGAADHESKEDRACGHEITGATP